jgi:putative two-component system response regulator
MTSSADATHALPGTTDPLLLVHDDHDNAANILNLLAAEGIAAEVESVDSFIGSLAQVVEARDAYTEGHCQRLATYAAALGTKLGLGERDVTTLRRGGYLHDVGKVAVPDGILMKRQGLSPEEFDIIKSHTVIGESLCGSLKSLAPVRAIVRHHHERLDGSGYPDGLRGDEIPLLAQIMGVVDAFDAMTTTRPYREAMTIDAACEELQADASFGKMSGELVNAFVDLIADVQARWRSQGAVESHAHA